MNQSYTKNFSVIYFSHKICFPKKKKKAEPSTSDGRTFWGSFFFKIPSSRKSRRDVRPKMAAVDMARVETATQVFSEKIQTDTGPWTLTLWLNSAQMRVYSCPREGKSNVSVKDASSVNFKMKDVFLL